MTELPPKAPYGSNHRTQIWNKLFTYFPLELELDA